MAYIPGQGAASYLDNLNLYAEQAQQDALLAEQQAAAYAQQAEQQVADYQAQMNDMLAQQQQMYDNTLAQFQQTSAPQQSSSSGGIVAPTQTPSTGNKWGDLFKDHYESLRYGTHGFDVNAGTERAIGATLHNRKILDDFVDQQALRYQLNDMDKENIRNQIKKSIASYTGNKNVFDVEERDWLSFAGDTLNTLADGAVGSAAELVAWGNALNYGVEKKLGENSYAGMAVQAMNPIALTERATEALGWGDGKMNWDKSLVDGVAAARKWFGSFRSEESQDAERARNLAANMTEMWDSIKDNPTALSDELFRMVGMIAGPQAAAAGVRAAGAGVAKAGAKRALMNGASTAEGSSVLATTRALGIQDDVLRAGAEQIGKTTGLSSLVGRGVGTAQMNIGRSMMSAQAPDALLTASMFEAAGTGNEVLRAPNAWDDTTNAYTDDALATSAISGLATGGVTYGMGRAFGTIEGSAARLMANRTAERAQQSTLGKMVIQSRTGVTIDDALKAVTTDLSAGATQQAAAALRQAEEILTSAKARQTLLDALGKSSPALKSVFAGTKTITGSMLAEGFEEGLIGAISSVATQGIGTNGDFRLENIDFGKALDTASATATLGSTLGVFGGAMNIAQRGRQATDTIDATLAEYQTKLDDLRQQYDGLVAADNAEIDRYYATLETMGAGTPVTDLPYRINAAQGTTIDDVGAIAANAELGALRREQSQAATDTYLQSGQQSDIGLRIATVLDKSPTARRRAALLNKGQYPVVQNGINQQLGIEQPNPELDLLRQQYREYQPREERQAAVNEATYRLERAQYNLEQLQAQAANTQDGLLSQQLTAAILDAQAEVNVATQNLAEVETWVRETPYAEHRYENYETVRRPYEPNFVLVGDVVGPQTNKDLDIEYVPDFVMLNDEESAAAEEQIVNTLYRLDEALKNAGGNNPLTRLQNRVRHQANKAANEEARARQAQQDALLAEQEATQQQNIVAQERAAYSNFAAQQRDVVGQAQQHITTYQTNKAQSIHEAMAAFAKWATNAQAQVERQNANRNEAAALVEIIDAIVGRAAAYTLAADVLESGNNLPEQVKYGLSLMSRLQAAVNMLNSGTLGVAQEQQLREAIVDLYDLAPIMFRRLDAFIEEEMGAAYADGELTQQDIDFILADRTRRERATGEPTFVPTGVKSIKALLDSYGLSDHKGKGKLAGLRRTIEKLLGNFKGRNATNAKRAMLAYIEAGALSTPATDSDIETAREAAFNAAVNFFQKDGQDEGDANASANEVMRGVDATLESLAYLKLGLPSEETEVSEAVVAAADSFGFTETSDVDANVDVAVNDTANAMVANDVPPEVVTKKRGGRKLKNKPTPTNVDLFSEVVVEPQPTTDSQIAQDLFSDVLVTEQEPTQTIETDVLAAEQTQPETVVATDLLSDLPITVAQLDAMKDDAFRAITTEQVNAMGKVARKSYDRRKAALDKLDVEKATRNQRAMQNNTRAATTTYSTELTEREKAASAERAFQDKIDKVAEAKLQRFGQTTFDFRDSRWGKLSHEEQSIEVQRQTIKRGDAELRSTLGDQVAGSVVWVSPNSLTEQQRGVRAFIADGDPNTIYVVATPTTADYQFTYAVAHELLHRGIDVNVRGATTKWGDYKATMDKFASNPFVSRLMGAMKVTYPKLDKYALAEEALAEIHAARTAKNGWKTLQDNWGIHGDIPVELRSQTDTNFITKIVNWFKSVIAKLRGTSETAVTNSDVAEFLRVVSRQGSDKPTMQTPTALQEFKARVNFQAAEQRAKYYGDMARNIMPNFTTLSPAVQSRMLADLAKQQGDTQAELEFSSGFRFSKKP